MVFRHLNVFMGTEDRLHDGGTTADFLFVAAFKFPDFQTREQALDLPVIQPAAFNTRG